jgi:adenine/guanine phosphoribosyltransferase-like PRPP-binding protein
VDGLPLAVILEHRLGVNMVMANNSREVGVGTFFEEVYVPGEEWERQCSLVNETRKTGLGRFD